jgi:hypothetical protein
MHRTAFDNQNAKKKQQQMNIASHQQQDAGYAEAAAGSNIESPAERARLAAERMKLSTKSFMDGVDAQVMSDDLRIDPANEQH